MYFKIEYYNLYIIQITLYILKGYILLKWKDVSYFYFNIKYKANILILRNHQTNDQVHVPFLPVWAFQLLCRLSSTWYIWAHFCFPLSFSNWNGCTFCIEYCHNMKFMFSFLFYSYIFWGKFLKNIAMCCQHFHIVSKSIWILCTNTFIRKWQHMKLKSISLFS